MNSSYVIVTGAFGYIGSSLLDTLIDKSKNTVFIGIVKDCNDTRRSSGSHKIKYMTYKELLDFDFSKVGRVDLVHCANSVSSDNRLAYAIRENFIFWFDLFVELSNRVSLLGIHLIESYWQYKPDNSYRYAQPYDISKTLLSESVLSEMKRFDVVRRYVLYDIYHKCDPRGKLLNNLANGYCGVLELKSARNLKTFVRWDECLDIIANIVTKSSQFKAEKYYLTHGNSRPLAEIVNEIIEYYKLPIRLCGVDNINLDEPLEIVSIVDNPLIFTDDVIRDFSELL